ncbi:hypothetical protein Q9Q99_02460 [Curtobacterium flaccumfaciens]|nr:hypothetical protein Q9Q99_02460 [Curtobacterium flaccumfaciens]
MRGERAGCEDGLLDGARRVGRVTDRDGGRRQQQPHREHARDDPERQEQPAGGECRRPAMPAIGTDESAAIAISEEREGDEGERGGGAEHQPGRRGGRDGDEQGDGQERSRGHLPIQPVRAGRRMERSWASAWRPVGTPSDR